MSPAQKTQVFSRIEPDFAKLTPDQQSQFMSTVQRRSTMGHLANLTPSMGQSDLDKSIASSRKPPTTPEEKTNQMFGAVTGAIKRAGDKIANAEQTPISSAISGLAGLVRMPFQAVGEEFDREPKDSMEKPLQYGPPGFLALKRLLIDPAATTLKKGTDTIQQPGALKKIEGGADITASFLPGLGPLAVDLGEQAGTGDILGAATKGAVYHYAPEKIIKGLAKIPDIAKSAGQEAGGAGRFPVLSAEDARLKVLKERLENFDRSDQERISKNAEQAKKFASSAEGAKSERLATHSENIRGQQAAEKAAAQKESLLRGHEAYTKAAMDNVRSTHGGVRAALDSRWSNLREKIGAQTPLNPVPIAESVDIAREKLQGFPDDLKIFNQVMNAIEEPNESVDTPGGATPLLKPMSWEQSQTAYTALGDKLYSGDLPSNVYKALKTVREGIGDERMEVAKSKGAGPDLRSINKDWSSYMDDWHDMRNMSTGGGSPLARALRIQDPKTFANLAKGAAGDRLLETHGKYANRGAKPEVLAKSRDLLDRATKLKVGKFTPKSLPEVPKDAPIPKSRANFELPEPIDPAQVRQKILRSAVGTQSGFFQSPLRMGLKGLANAYPPLVDILARHPRAELAPTPLDPATIDLLKKYRNQGSSGPGSSSTSSRPPIPPTPPPASPTSPASSSSQRAGTAAGAARDTGSMAQARAELGPNASISDVIAAALKVNQEFAERGGEASRYKGPSPSIEKMKIINATRENLKEKVRAARSTGEHAQAVAALLKFEAKVEGYSVTDTRGDQKIENIKNRNVDKPR